MRTWQPLNSVVSTIFLGRAPKDSLAICFYILPWLEFMDYSHVTKLFLLVAKEPKDLIFSQ